MGSTLPASPSQRSVNPGSHTPRTPTSVMRPPPASACSTPLATTLSNALATPRAGHSPSSARLLAPLGQVAPPTPPLPGSTAAAAALMRTTDLRSVVASRERRPAHEFTEDSAEIAAPSAHGLDGASLEDAVASALYAASTTDMPTSAFATALPASLEGVPAALDEDDDVYWPHLPPAGFLRRSWFDDERFESATTLALVARLATVGAARRERAAAAEIELAASRRQRRRLIFDAEEAKKIPEEKGSMPEEKAMLASGGGGNGGGEAEGCGGDDPDPLPPDESDRHEEPPNDKQAGKGGGADVVEDIALAAAIDETGAPIRGWSRYCDADRSWRWAPVIVEAYDATTDLFEVRWEGDEQTLTRSAHSPGGSATKRVGRLNLLLSCDDPKRYAERIAAARTMQETTEASARWATGITVKPALILS